MQDELPSIDFELKIDDSNRILFVVKNVQKSINKKFAFDCSFFNESECHHQEESTAAGHNLKKCTFCQFFDLIKDKNGSMKISNDLLRQLTLNQNVTGKHFLFNAKFKKQHRINAKSLEWCEFQPFRTPFAFIAFASCSNQQDLLSAVKNYETEKEKLKKYAHVSKLFIDLHSKHEMSDEFKTSLKLTDSTKNSSDASLQKQASLDVVSPADGLIYSASFDLEHAVTDAEKIEHPLQYSNLDSIRSNNSDLTDLKFEFGDVVCGADDATSSSSSSENCRPKLFSYQVSVISDVSVDEVVLNFKLKSLEKEIVYLDFLFAQDGVDKISAIVESEKAKIESSLKECLILIVKNLSDKLKDLDTESDKQINFFSDLLKTPADRSLAMTQSTLSATSVLSIKVINKKLITARMHKNKADVYMLLNSVNSAIYHYYQAYNLARKEDDEIWAVGALEGLCAASYLYLLESKSGKRDNLTSSTECKFEFFQVNFKFHLFYNKWHIKNYYHT